ncbi:MAG TPA: hypothetical protein DCQ97_03710 [Chitinophagaceae bacterium]|nr:hypothetical protein [Chitinophagaceae bacterium]
MGQDLVVNNLEGTKNRPDRSRNSGKKAIPSLSQRKSPEKYFYHHHLMTGSYIQKYPCFTGTYKPRQQTASFTIPVAGSTGVFSYLCYTLKRFACIYTQCAANPPVFKIINPPLPLRT